MEALWKLPRHAVEKRRNGRAGAAGDWATTHVPRPALPAYSRALAPGQADFTATGGIPRKVDPAICVGWIGAQSGDFE